MLSKLWAIRCVRVGEERQMLLDGWEPFSVTSHDESYYFLNTSHDRRERKSNTVDYLYLKRKLDTPMDAGGLTGQG